MIYCQWSARVHQRESTAAGAIKIDLTSHSIRPDVCTSIIFQSAMTLVSTWWERSLGERGSEWKYMHKTPNRNIKLLSPTKSLCTIVSMYRRRETKIESRFQVLWKCMNHWERFCCFYTAVLWGVFLGGGEILLFCIWGVHLRKNQRREAHEERNSRNDFKTLGNETMKDESVHILCTRETLTSYIIMNFISNKAHSIAQFESNVYIISLKSFLSGNYPVISAL